MPDDGAPVEEIKRLTFRAARAKYHLSYERWRDIKKGKIKEWHPYLGGGVPQADVEEILDSVRSYPAWNTRQRAASLKKRTETVQRVLVGKGLSRLNARLKFAGYSVDIVQPLARARQHRVLAAGPGVYACIDFKRLGAIRRLEPGDRQKKSQLFSGLQCVDAYSGFASVYICEEQNSDAAVAGFQHFREQLPSKAKGLVLSDNGLAFLSDIFVAYLLTQGFVQRTTQFNHPWSNGKVEAFNRTLKYQAMPALVAAGVKGYAEAQAWMDKWMRYYNYKRAHSGWINRGLPPAAVIDRWDKTPGDVFEKLATLGHIKKDEVHRTRLMGSGRHAVDLGLEHSAPYAFIIEAPPPRPPAPFKVGWTLPK